MSGKYYCPRLKSDCPHAEMCGKINEPLFRAVPHIRKTVGEIPLRTARNQLEYELDTQANPRVADWHTSFDKDGTASVCPVEVMDADKLVERAGEYHATVTMKSMTEMCVQNAITALNYMKQQGLIH